MEKARVITQFKSTLISISNEVLSQSNSANVKGLLYLLSSFRGRILSVKVGDGE